MDKRFNYAIRLFKYNLTFNNLDTIKLQS